MKQQLTANALPGHRVLAAITTGVAITVLGGCMMLGPDYERPQSAVNPSWLESSPAIREEPAEIREWWTAFDDPVLTRLVHEAYEQNLSLVAADPGSGPARHCRWRVLPARAENQRGLQYGRNQHERSQQPAFRYVPYGGTQLRRNLGAGFLGQVPPQHPS